MTHLFSTECEACCVFVFSLETSPCSAHLQVEKEKEKENGGVTGEEEEKPEDEYEHDSSDEEVR